MANLQITFDAAADPNALAHANRVDREHDQLLAPGATYLWTTQDRGPRTVTMRGPEGNVFCLS